MAKGLYPNKHEYTECILDEHLFSKALGEEVPVEWLRSIAPMSRSIS